MNISAWISRFLVGLGVAGLTAMQQYLTTADYSELGVWAAVGLAVGTALAAGIGALVKKLGPDPK